ncbi:hypothetical protein ME790_01740 [Lactobacillus delbrueckii]|uniref:conserved phage C-terminal domain-containing protein n=1 Tax=Lactobacillus delbrueckii TaxID=1584 RepID=UPI001F2F1A32|nr:conserved phage C-terminal domain-containing protein [Lactobacillus delbrueckii]GHN31103.1 hypothetical protein ME790_01740 [Lactobacillus delbrueckii]
MAKRKITNQSRDFKGVWIPAEYWLDPNLTMMEIMFITEIDSLDRGEGCFASNNHFADFFGVTPGRASQIIKSLEKKGYIELTYEREGKRVVRRLIMVVRKLNGGIKYSKGGYLENAEGSNTVFSNTKSNTEEGSKAGQSPTTTSPVNKKEKIPYKEIIDYLNEKTGSHYKDVAGNQKMIRARWNEGYRLDDFRKVIDNKTDAWLGFVAKDGREMSQYLRPSTLFGPKFDQYLNEVVTRDNTQAGSLFDQQWTPENEDDLPF